MTCRSSTNTRTLSPCVTTCRKRRTDDAHVKAADATAECRPSSTLRSSTARPVTRTYRKFDASAYLTHTPPCWPALDPRSNSHPNDTSALPRSSVASLSPAPADPSVTAAPPPEAMRNPRPPSTQR